MSGSCGRAGKSEPVEECQRRVANRCQDRRRAPLAGTAGILSERHVASVMQRILNGPVRAAKGEQGGRVALSWRQTRDAVFVFHTGLAIGGGLSAYPVDLLQSGPVGTVFVEQRCRVDRSLFMPAVRFGNIGGALRLLVNQLLLSGGKGPVVGRMRPRYRVGDSVGSPEPATSNPRRR